MITDMITDMITEHIHEFASRESSNRASWISGNRQHRGKPWRARAACVEHGSLWTSHAPSVPSCGIQEAAVRVVRRVHNQFGSCRLAWFLRQLSHLHWRWRVGFEQPRHVGL